jgi:hypothetical protein
VGIILIQKGIKSKSSGELTFFVKILCLKKSGTSKKTSKMYPLKILPKHNTVKGIAILRGTS